MFYLIREIIARLYHTALRGCMWEIGVAASSKHPSHTTELKNSAESTVSRARDGRLWWLHSGNKGENRQTETDNGQKACLLGG